MNKQWIDGHLLDEFRLGNRAAIKEVCSIAATWLNEGTLSNPDLILLLGEALASIGGGADPNSAFGWSGEKNGRRRENLVLRDWEVKKSVQLFMLSGLTWTAACHAVSSDSGGEFLLGKKTIEHICKKLEKDTPLPIPDEIFPLPAREYRNKNT
jgi:hypothetical protein